MTFFLISLLNQNSFRELFNTDNLGLRWNPYVQHDGHSTSVQVVVKEWLSEHFYNKRSGLQRPL